MRRVASALAAACIAFVAASIVVFPAYAQDRAPEPVLQTEPDKPAPGNAQALPMTKDVVSGQALEQAPQEGYAEAVKGVAGVSPANSAGSANDSVNIRGIKLNLFANYRLNGGLPLTGVITAPTENKERVETLKGANALMFGIASPAGIFNLITKRAGPIDVTRLAMAGNSFGQYGGSFDVGRRFGAEKELGLRVNASAAHLENGVRNMGGNGQFYSVGFDYRLTERLSIQGDYEDYRKHVPEQAGISLLVPVNGVVPITPVPNPRNPLSGRWDMYTPHTTNQQVRADYLLDDRWKILAEAGRSDSTRSRLTARIGNYNLVTGAGGIVRVTAVSQRYTNTFSRAELQGKVSTWSLRHDLTIGASKAERDTETPRQDSVTLAQRQNIFDPIELAPPVFTRATPLPVQTSLDTAIYAYDIVSIGPKWKVLLGLRRTKNDEDNGVTRSSTTVYSPGYGVLYDVIPGVTVFASQLEGLEAGATAPVGAVNANQILPSAISTQKEIGIRDSHLKGLSLNGSYFQITRANAVTDPVTNVFGANGNIDYKGVEATLRYEFAPRWTLNAAGQSLQAIQRAPDPRIDGLAPENTPKLLGNLSLAFRPLWAPGWTLRAGATGISKRYVNPQDQGTIPGYVLYDAGVGYVTRIREHRVAFQVNVNNLANKRYWNSVQTGTYGTGMDRSIRFNARIDF
jgi:iron complex outermembrane receptor protein